MWYFIVTARSLIWMLLTLLCTLIMLSALVNPSWITAKPEEAQFDNETVSYTPSLGVYAKCGKPIGKFHPICTFLAVKGLSADSQFFPDAWKAATVFLGIGLCIMLLTVCTSMLSCCFQSVFRKSIFTLTGATQCVAGIFFIIGVMLHPMAWGSYRVQKLCGRDASPFFLGDCYIGLGLYLAAIGTVLTFGCACLSIPADKSTSSDKVQDKIFEGHSLICLA